MSCAAVLLCSQWIVGLRGLNINRDHNNLTSVPQDLDVAVTTLSLKYNNITAIDSSSLWRYYNLKELYINRNPLKEIKNGSFDNNPDLEVFSCGACKLHRFPVDFGPASNSLKYIDFSWGINNVIGFSQMKLNRFTSLSHLAIKGIIGVDFDSLNFPISLYFLRFGYMKLVTFPNLTFARFPNLNYVNAMWNTFQEGSNFRGVTGAVEFIVFDYSHLCSADGLELLSNLRKIYIMNNNLETIPDLLSLPKLKRLYIKGNTRMKCDQRMCWRRLWERVKRPLRYYDDVICVEPPLLAGYAMSKINPKFMQCSNGKWFSKDCNLYYFIEAEWRIYASVS